MEAGRTNSIIICAEGADDGRALSEWLTERTDIDICTTILGFIQRGGQPTARDGILGSTLGAAAVKALLEGETGALAGMHRGEVRIISYEEAKRKRNRSNRNSTNYPSCWAPPRAAGISGKRDYKEKHRQKPVLF